MSAETEQDWGELSWCEGYGKHGDTKDDYKVLDYEHDEVTKTDYQDYQHGSHAMIYALDNGILWNLYKCRAAVLDGDTYFKYSIREMQMRFDGLIGFPGGLVDPGEDPLTGLNRELEEEIGLDLNKHAFDEGDHIVSFLHEKKRLILHFYVKRVTHDDFREIEAKNLKAPDYGSETLGIIRPPLYTMGDNFRGLPAFLANQFAGNAREELMRGLVHTEILTAQEMKKALDSCENFMNSRR